MSEPYTSSDIYVFLPLFDFSSLLPSELGARERPIRRRIYVKTRRILFSLEFATLNIAITREREREKTRARVLRATHLNAARSSQVYAQATKSRTKSEIKGDGERTTSPSYAYSFYVPTIIRQLHACARLVNASCTAERNQLRAKYFRSEIE